MGAKTFVSLLALAGVCMASAQVRDARAALVQALDKTRRVSVEALVLKRSSDNCSPFRLKLQQNKTQQLTTILSPLSQQGVVIFEDGKSLKTYWPDIHKMMIQASCRPTNMEIGKRLELAAKNYSFVFGSQVQIAGRTADVIEANPKFKEMPRRSYSVDNATSFVLRISTTYKGETQTQLDTLAFHLGNENSDADLTPKPLQLYKVIRPAEPINFFDAKAIASVVGFKPAVPTYLPYGFEVFDKTVSGRDHKYASIAISDGLAQAVILQFPAEWDDLAEDAPTVESKNVKIQIVGDLPSAVMQKILNTFLKKLVEGLNSFVGTDTAQILFKQECNGGVTTWTITTPQGTCSTQISTTLSRKEEP